LSSIYLRILSALVLAPVVLYAVYLGGVWFRSLILLCLLLSIIEWIRLCRVGNVSGLERLAWLLPGVVYIAVSCASLVLVRDLSDAGQNIVFFILAAVWVADTGAYVAGSIIGGPKLAPKISPKKTWAGLLGALVGAGIAGSMFLALFPEKGLLELTISGMVLGGVAQIGDLVESLAKRRFGVKDSGTLIPGHGGILDRIDGLMPASLAVGIASGALANGIRTWF